MSFPMGLGGSGPFLRSAAAKEMQVATAPPTTTSFPSLYGSSSAKAAQQQQQSDSLLPREPQAGLRSSTRPAPSKGEDSTLPELHSGSTLLLQQVRGPPISGSTGAELIVYRPVQVGLENLGNTCFMNTSLQCLLHIQPLISYFLGADVERAINPQSPTKGTLARSFAQLCRDVFSKQPKSITPTSFQKAVGALAPHLLDFQQQDCQEFLRFLLDGMSEDLCRPGATAAPAVAPPASTPAATASTAAAAVAPTPSAAASELPELARAGKAGGNTPSRLRAAALGAAQPEQLGLAPIGAQSQGQGQRNDEASEALGAMELLSLSSPTQPTKEAKQQQSSEMDDAESSPAQRHRRRVVNRSDAAGAQSSSSSSSPLRDSGKRGVVMTTWQGPAPETVASPDAQPETSDLASKAPALTLDELASQSWAQYLRKNDSIITDLFAGQLQSTIECQSCHKTSTCFDPFLDLSVPIPRPEAGAQGRGGLLGRAASAKVDAKACTLHECLAKFTSIEVLEDDNAYSCEHCKQKRRGHKRLLLYKLPHILVIHIKRFRFNSLSRDKLSTDVQFPSSSLDLGEYCSADRPAGGRSSPIYDLFAVSSHSGSMNGGHYVAHCDINGGWPVTGANGGGMGKREAAGQMPANWVCFNDARASPSSLGSIAGPSAYVLFYRQRGP